MSRFATSRTMSVGVGCEFVVGSQIGELLVMLVKPAGVGAGSSCDVSSSVVSPLKSVSSNMMLLHLSS